MSETVTEETVNKCMLCGACCAMYKITFANCEAELDKSGCVPLDMTLAAGTSKRIMKGTETGRKRCIALEGNVGHRVRCTIYDRRPSPCRAFRATWQEYGMNDQCNRARAIYGLPAFDVI
jgi:Fe-S-cluster containining protein